MIRVQHALDASGMRNKVDRRAQKPITHDWSVALCVRPEVFQRVAVHHGGTTQDESATRAGRVDTFCRHEDILLIFLDP